jgi:hypothetical protein
LTFFFTGGTPAAVFKTVLVRALDTESDLQEVRPVENAKININAINLFMH